MESLFGKGNKRAPLFVVLLVVILLPLMSDDPFYLSLIIGALVWSVVAMGFSAVMRTGSFSMGQAAFMAIGGYTACLLQKNLGISFWYGLLIAGVIAALSAAVIGIIVLRLSGMYFSIITLAFGEAVRVIAENWLNVTGGMNGIIPDPPSPIHIGSLTIDFVSSQVPYYYLILIIVIIAALVFWRLDGSRFGRVSRSIATNELLAQHTGMHPMKYRVVIFTIAGFFTGVAGAYSAFYHVFLHPANFGMNQSIAVAIMAVIGGSGSPVAGPVIGALIVSAVGDYLTTLLAGLKPLVYGIMVVVILFLLPNGMVQLRDSFVKLFRGQPGIQQRPGAARNTR